MAPRKNPEVYTQMLNSILAPHTYMKGLIAGAVDRVEDSYTIPQGLSAELCMLAVLGGIVSDDNIATMSTVSSSGSIQEKDWKKIWFIRDYAGSDEYRGYNVTDTISKGRQKAIEAFNAYSNGDPSALNGLINSAAQSIQMTQEHTYQMLGNSWDNTHAATKLLVNVANQVKPEGVTEINPEVKMNSDLMVVWDEFLTRENELEDKLKSLSPDALEERNELLLEKYTYNRIKEDYFKEKSNEVNAPGDLIPQEVLYYSKDFSLRHSSIYKSLSDHYVDLYKQTHPSKLVHAFSNPDTRRALFNQYKAQIEASEEFKTEAASDNPRSNLNRIKLNINIPDYLSSSERSKLEKQWIDQTQNAKKEYLEVIEQFEKGKENFEKKLGEIANSFALQNYKVFQADALTAKQTLFDIIIRQNNLYLYDDRYGNIIQVHSDNGKDYTAKPVYEFGEDSSSKQSIRNTIYGNGIIRALRAHNKFLTIVNAKYKPESNGYKRLQNDTPLHAAFYKDLTDLQNLCKQALGGMTDEIYSGIKDKLAIVTDKINTLPKDAKNVGQLMYAAKLFSFSLSDELKTADRLYEEKLTKFTAPNPVAYEDRLKLAQLNSGELAKQQEISSLIKQHSAGSRQTDVQLNLPALLSKFEQEVAADPEMSDRCEEYISSLDELSELTNRLYERDAEGHFKPMSSAEFKELISAYNATLEAVGKLDLQSSNNTALSMIDYHIKGMLKNDMSALMNIQPGTGMSLPEAINQGRTRRVDVSGKELSYVGEKSNKRYALSIEENGKTIKGFFTNDKVYKTGEALRAEAEKCFSAMRKNHPEVNFLVDYMVNDMIFNKVSDYYTLVANAVEYSKTTDVAKYNAKINNCSIDVITRTYYDLLRSERINLDDAGTLLIQYDYLLNADEGSSISNRNVAMSKVANLFGIPDIIAQSVPMELYDNGNITKGIFMANAKGRSISSIMPEDAVNATPETNNTSTLIKDVANLQILDYICNNSDRHNQNIFFIFNEDNSKIIGIQGIDNDLSFGTIKRPSDEISEGAVDVSLDKIEIITKELADNLMSLNDMTFSNTLAGTGLSNREIDAALDRLHNVQNNISLQKIKVVDSEGISKLNMKDLAKEGNLFNVAYGSTVNLQETAKENLTNKLAEEEEKRKETEKRLENGLAPEEKKPFKFEKTELLNGINVASLTNDIREFKSISTRITASQKDIFGSGSDQFRRLQNAVENYYKQIKNISSNPNERELLQFRTNLEAVYESAEDYIKLKKSRDGLSEKTKERFDIASEISAYTKNRFKEFTKEAARVDEIKVEDMNAELKAKAVLLSKASNKVNVESSVDQDKKQLDNQPKQSQLIL